MRNSFFMQIAEAIGNIVQDFVKFGFIRYTIEALPALLFYQVKKRSIRAIFQKKKYFGTIKLLILLVIN